MARRLDRVDAMMAGLVLVWGTAFPTIDYLGQALDPYQMTWFRYAPFPVAYGAWLALRRRGVFAQVRGKDWVLMGAMGFFGVTGYHFPLNWGMHGADGVTGATGAILVATGPIFTLLVAVALRQERLRLAAVAGSCLAFAGAAVIVARGQGKAELEIAARAAVILLAPLSWAMYSVLAKPLVQRYGGIFVTGVTMGMGTLALLPLGLHYGTAPLEALEPGQWAALGFLSLLSTLAGYAIWNQALKQRSASDVAVYIYLQPAISALVGALWFGEAITLWFIGGGALVLAGVILVNRARLPSAPKGPSAVHPPPAPAAEATPPAREPPRSLP